MTKRVISQKSVIQRGLLGERYKSLCAKLVQYYLDAELNEARKTILRFVVGLRFSSLLTYEIRRILHGTRLNAHWGTIIDEDHYSPECDIVIHRGASEFSWNGDDDYRGRVMDFHFVQKERVALVVSCKSRIDEISADMKNDVKRLSRYTHHVWLVAQCCEAKKLDRLRRNALNAGYEKFVHLFTLTPHGVGCEYDENVWYGFVDSLRGLASS
jgi:hypothetical protein